MDRAIFKHYFTIWSVLLKTLLITMLSIPFSFNAYKYVLSFVHQHLHNAAFFPFLIQLNPAIVYLANRKFGKCDFFPQPKVTLGKDPL